jgi:hypothetical protein
MMETCKKCGGKGSIDIFRHVDNGVCYACNGTGKVVAKKIKADTTGKVLEGPVALDPQTTPAVSFKVAFNDYREWVVKQPFIRKRFYTYEDGVRTLLDRIVKHFGGKVLDVDDHTCIFKYEGINFVVESKNAYVYSICEDY